MTMIMVMRKALLNSFSSVHRYSNTVPLDRKSTSEEWTRVRTLEVNLRTLFPARNSIHQ